MLTSVIDLESFYTEELSVLEKQMLLDMRIYEYECASKKCKSFVPTETFDRLLNYNIRVTKLLEDVACVLTIETRFEASAHIMKAMNKKLAETLSFVYF